MEHITTPKVEQVKLLDRLTSKKPAVGTLYLTATHLIYVESSPELRRETWILHHHISAIEKLPLTSTGCPLLIHCKNFRVTHFVICRERDCHDVYSSLLKLSQPVLFEELYAFSYNPKQNEMDRGMGWKMLDIREEFQRMGVPNEYWEQTDVNEGYETCNTYSTFLCVPKGTSKPIIVGSSKFRSRGRFPVLSYFFKENSLNAMANRAAGKGYENEDHYSNIRFQFIGIENIHVMRNSLQKLLEVCELKAPSMSEFLTGLENSGWLRHIKTVMDAGAFLAKAVAEENASVLVHCSDGWDRTVQVCSLAALLLDSYYRSIKGFMVLVEKEWISMGHKFSQRCGHLEGDPKEVSPVFTQFIECTWHLMEQFPCAFEFNERYLLEIHDHVFSCQFGNFIGNCQKERQELKLQEKTYSLWPFLLEKQYLYQNPLYKSNAVNIVLKPNTAPFNFKFWCGMYNRFDKGMQPRQSVLDCLHVSMKQKIELEETVTGLNQKLTQQDQSQSGATFILPMKISIEDDSSQSQVLGVPQDYMEEQQILLANGTEELIETISDGNQERDNVTDSSFSHQSTLNNIDCLGLVKLNVQVDEGSHQISQDTIEK
ncbi:phosphatidylinositol-3,5-bisphosphate 3-phosphatase MTMR8 isoform X2 [Scyliorhinus torazame]|uniref:phosphatidylinositol-3,5-bisphosphate 3-phosphatase MTMR8 isoform X2 n=1 Tax=Scyliorhinus torazame TaxID=75743 RepID=UPI003B5A9F6E